MSNSVRYPSRFELRVAIALNNMAVTMAERDCYEQAFATFQDAVTALKIPVKLGGGGGAKKQAPTTCCVEKLHQANQRLSKPRPTDRRSLPLRVVAQFEAASHLLSRQSSSQQQRRAAATTRQPLTLIRADDVELQMAAPPQEQNDKPGATAQLHIAMVIYNFGIASLCLAAGQQDEANKAQRAHQMVGIKLLRVAKSLLGQLLAPPTAQQRVVHEPMQLVQILFCATLTMESLVDALFQQQDHNKEAKSYLPKVVQLRAAGETLLRNDGTLFGAVMTSGAGGGASNLPTGASAA